MYFKKFPLIFYSFDESTKQIVRDITLRVKQASFIKDSIYIYDKYSVMDGERPETVAAKIYGNPFLHWVLMNTNDIIDPYEDWPRSEREVIDWVSQNMDPLEIHHYENRNGEWVENNAFESIPVTNEDYYISLNDKKRLINIVKPELVSTFVGEFNRVITK